jgi:DNA-binding NarL/FixJ family response regulator
MKKLRVMLVDDHKILIEGLRSMLEPEFAIAGEYADAREAVEAAERLRPDVVIMDISMPGINGIEAARRLSMTAHRVRVLMLTMHSDLSMVRAAFRAGAAGYLMKSAAAEELANAIRTVARGQRYVCPRVKRKLDEVEPNFLKAVERDSGELTGREIQVLALLAKGRTRKEIGHELGISAKTVEYHRSRIARKLGMTTTAQLIAYAVEHGLLDT